MGLYEDGALWTRCVIICNTDYAPRSFPQLFLLYLVKYIDIVELCLLV